MRKLSALVIATVSAAAFVTPASAASMSNTVKLKVSATGANVTMASNMKMGGAKSGSATAVFTLDSKKNTLCSVVSTKGLTAVVEAHIHVGATGVDGSDVVPFDVKKFNTKAAVCQPVAAALIAKLVANPSGYYFNVHTKAEADGAVRGQLVKG